MKKILFISLIFFLLNSFQNLIAQDIKPIRSPDKNLELILKLSKESELSYSFIALVEGILKNRQIISLKITHESRRNDLEIMLI